MPQLHSRKEPYHRLLSFSQDKKKPLKIRGLNYGGGTGIRTLGRLSPSPVFKTGAFNRSAIPPAYGGEYYQFRLAGQVFAAFPIDVADQQDIEHLRLEPTDGILGLLKDCHNDQPQGALT